MKELKPIKTILVENIDANGGNYRKITAEIIAEFRKLMFEHEEWNGSGTFKALGIDLELWEQFKHINGVE